MRRFTTLLGAAVLTAALASPGFVLAQGAGGGGGAGAAGGSGMGGSGM